MSALGQRFFFGTIILGAVILLLVADAHTGASTGFFILCLFFFGIGWLEYARLVGVPGRPWKLFGLLIIAAAIGSEWALSGVHRGPPSAALRARLQAVVLFFPFLWPVAYLLGSLYRVPSRQRLSELGLGAWGIVYMLVPALCCVRLRHLGQGDQWILFLVLLVKGNDIGAFLVGRWWGRRRLIAVSPNKTVEGSAGGLLAGIGVALGFSLLPAEPLFGAGWAVVFGAAGGVAGQVGDLLESYLKRAAGVKDSASLIPAFGGGLDLLDSLLLGAPVIYLLAMGRAA